MTPGLVSHLFYSSHTDCFLMHCVNTELYSTCTQTSIPACIYSKPPYFNQSAILCIWTYYNSTAASSMCLPRSIKPITICRIYGSEGRTDAQCSFSTNGCLFSQKIYHERGLNCAQPNKIHSVDSSRLEW